jgi:hypothetical protein
LLPSCPSQALAKFAFGMGTLQVVGTTLLFTGFALPAGRSWGTVFLEAVAHAPPSLVSIRTVDEVGQQGLPAAAVWYSCTAASIALQ